MSDLSERRFIENEVMFKNINAQISRFVTDGASQPDKLIPFYCECSNRDCRLRIKLTPGEYRQQHKNKRFFVVRKGHDLPEVETIIDKKQNYYLVEKNIVSPLLADIDSSLRNPKLIEEL